MKNRYLLLIVLLAFIISSCSESAKEIETLRAEVMAIHDHKAMPKMEKIMRYKNKLKAVSAELESNGENSEADIKNTIAALDEANMAMMEWMRNYDAKMEDMSDEEKIAYLKKEREAIESVDEIMDNAINQAKVLLNE